MGSHPIFAPEEFAARAARLRAKLKEAGVAIGLFDEIEAMAWISGYGNSENRWRCVGIPTDPGAGDPFFLIRVLDSGPCRDRIWFDDVPTFRDWDDPMQALASALQKRGMAESAIGLDLGSYSMSAARFEKLKKALPGARFVDLGPLVNELRLIKSPAEIDLLRRAASVADRALVEAARACVPGASQRDAAKAAAAAFVDLGAEPGWPGPISGGRGGDFLHAHLSDAKLSKGDVVHIELIPRVEGYSGRIMRCVSIGAPSAELARAAELLAEIQDRQIAAIKPGANAGEVDAILRDGVLKAGLRQQFDHISGYTLGLYSHATPRTSDFTRIFHPGAAWTIEKDMAFHIYVGAAGVSFSETVLVTATGAERLTQTPRKLIVNSA